MDGLEFQSGVRSNNFDILSVDMGFGHVLSNTNRHKFN